MKKLLLAVIFIFAGLNFYAQTDGISYQAVIIDPNGIELPGVDSDGNILPNAKISIRFTILDATNSEEYQEVQTTQTDLYGRINLIIGNQNRENFALVQWDGTPKDLKVEIDFKGSGSNFVDMSREQLTFVPYSYHRNILARGTLIVDDTTDLNGELVVQGPTNLNSTLNVNDNNDTNLSGKLNVQGKTILKNNFEVDGLTVLNDSLNVKAKSNFSGNMQVTADAVFEGKMDFKSEEPANFNSMVIKDSMDVDGPSNFHRQVRISANTNLAAKTAARKIPASQGGALGSYALLIDSTEQGIAIVINGKRNTDNKFISFWDRDPISGDPATMWGRIEGISDTELESSDPYIQGRKSKNWDIFWAGYNLTKSGVDATFAVADLIAAYTSSTACLGVGACITAPIPSLGIVAAVGLILKVADAVIATVQVGLAIKERVQFHDNQFANIGITYASGAGDYAEWLPKENPTEIFIPGELVGIKNGSVTKNTWNAEKIMIVSTRPIVLGNMPQPNKERNSVKIAFMGQVPVKVLGKVTPGDYILPNELGSEFAKAVNPKDMKIGDYNKIAGVAWNIIEKITDGLNVVNVAVGVNSNDLIKVFTQQKEELESLKLIYTQLKAQVERSNDVLTELVPGYAEATEISKSIEKSKIELKGDQKNQDHIEGQVVYSSEDDIVYFEISKEQIDSAIEMAREQYLEMLNGSDEMNKIAVGKSNDLTLDLDNITIIPIEEHPFWQKIDSEPGYKENIVEMIQSKMDKAFHTHKKHAHKFTDLKVRK